MSKDKLAVMGSPDEVIQALMDVDQTVASIGVTLAEFETDYDSKAEWDSPPELMVCYRKLPPTELADTLKDAGLMGMMLGVRSMGIPEEIITAAPPWMILDSLAQALTEERDAAREALMNDGNDLVAWILVWEAWEAKGITTEQFNDPTFLPSEQPDRIEVRLVYAVDRAGYRYTICRERVSGLLSMYADEGTLSKDTKDMMHGRLFDALVRLMEATPEPVE